MVDIKNIGAAIRDIRISRGLSQKQVSEGIFCKAAYSRIETGKREPDKLLLDVLLERMGISVDMFGTNYSVVEYLSIEWRNSILERLDLGKWKQAQKQLSEYEKWLSGDGQELDCPSFHTQFSSYVHLVIRLENAPVHDMENDILEALRLTHPGFTLDDLTHRLYGEQEIALLTLMAENYYRNGRREKAVWLYRELLIYLETNVSDVVQRCRYYPEIVASLSKKLTEMEQYNQLDICEKGIDLLRAARRMNSLEVLLRGCLLKYEYCGIADTDLDNVKLYREVADLLSKIRERLGILKQEKNYPLLRAESRGYVLGEQLYRIRKCFEMSQQEFADHLCTGETLSRIERGVHKPKASLYIALMERVGVKACRFDPVVESWDYQDFLTVESFTNQLARLDYDEADKTLCKLEKNLNMDSIINRQLIQKNRAILDEAMGRIAPEEEIRLLWEAFYLTVPKGVDISIWPLNRSEVNILNNIAIALQNQSKLSEAIDLLMRVKKCFEFVMADNVNYRMQLAKEKEMLRHYQNNGMRLEYNAGAYLLCVRILTDFMGRAGRYNEAVEILKTAFGLAYKKDRIYDVRGLLYEYAWEIEQMMERDQADIAAIGEACIPLFYQSYLLADISGQKTIMHHIDKRCKEKYGEAWSLNLLL